MIKSLKSFSIIHDDIIKLNISVVRQYLCEIIEDITYEIDDNVKIIASVIEENSDIRFDTDNELGPIFLKQNIDYMFKVMMTENAGYEAFIRQFINVAADSETNIGIFNSGNYVGTIDFSFLGLETKIIEVESIKLDYYDDYQNMLTDIDGVFSELITRSSSFFQTRFNHSEKVIDRFSYSNLAFIKQLMRPDNLPLWIDIIKDRPYSMLSETTEDIDIWNLDYIDPEEYLSSLLSEQTIKVIDNNGTMKIFPNIVTATYQEESIDTKENRFVKFYLEYLLDILESIKKNTTNKSNKLYYELNSLTESILKMLREPFFSSIEKIKGIPHNSQVLQKRYPYNNVYKGYNDLQLRTKFSIDIYDESFLVGQKDVAKLYEYWIFIKIFSALNERFYNNYVVDDWITYSSETLNVNLSEKKSKKVVYKLNELSEMHLYYNKEYRNNVNIYYGRSYSNTLKPDISLEMYSKNALVASIHFDAKYKVPINGKYEIDDINKMHAYKDGIMGAIGAYALCLSDKSEYFYQNEKNEYANNFLFPSIGAFPMKISENEDIDQIVIIIEKFIEEIGIPREGIFFKEDYGDYNALERIVGNID